MSAQKVYVFICLLVLGLEVRAGNEPNYSSTPASEKRSTMPGSDHDGSGENSEEKMEFLGDAMMEMTKTCNETFKTPIAYIKELNETGQYTRVNQDAKCYIYCVLEQLGIVDVKGVVDMRNAEYWFPTDSPQKSDESLAKKCGDPRLRVEREVCDKAYNFITCLLSEKRSQINHNEH